MEYAAETDYSYERVLELLEMYNALSEGGFSKEEIEERRPE